MRISERAKRDAATAASAVGHLDGERLPAGEVHGWWHGQGETVCGLSLHRSQLTRFAAVPWSEVQPDSGSSADLVRDVCERCAAALRPGTARSGAGWQRTRPRP